MQNGLDTAEGFSTHQELNPSRLTPCNSPSALSHWFVSIARKKTVCLAIFRLEIRQDCRSQIVQVEYQGQTRNTRILECKPLIDTSDRIRHRLELKYFHFAQFLLNAHRAAHRPRKSEN